MKRRLLQIGVLGLLLAVGVWFVLGSRVKVPEVIRIGDGSASGRYASLNRRLARLLEPIFEQEFGSRLEVVHTQGSVDNLRRLEQGELDIAFFQEGVGRSAAALSVINLEFELLHVIVNADSDIRSFADLEGRRVNIGPADSGTHMLAQQVIDYYPLEVQLLELSFDQAVKRFDGDLDAAFFVTGSHAPVIKALLADGRHRLVPLTFGTAMQLTHSWIEARTIPAMAYRRSPRIPEAEFPTIGVKSSLIAAKELPAPVVEAVVRAILETSFVQEANLLHLRDTKQTGFAHSDTHFPVHPGAAAYFHPWEPTIPSDFVESWNGIIGVLVLVLTALYTVATQLKAKADLAKKNALDVYVHRVASVCEQVTETEEVAALRQLRRELTRVNLQAAQDYQDEKFRGSADFVAFTTQAGFVLQQIQAKIDEVGDGREGRGRARG